MNTTTESLPTAVIIPARNEAEGLGRLLPLLRSHSLTQVVVVDNGSRDGTAEVGRATGATVVRERRIGYGAACHAGIRALAESVRIVVFLDADLADDPAELPRLVRPIACGDADLTIGVRVRARREPGSMTVPQRFGNWLATTLIRLGWRHEYADLGPFRAIERSALDRLDMRDRRFGWTVEMQIRAVEERLRIVEVRVPYRRRVGRSKISGTVRGVFLAGYWILRTIVGLWWSRRRRALGRRPPSSGPSR